jgi:hypothetical protein
MLYYAYRGAHQEREREDGNKQERVLNCHLLMNKKNEFHFVKNCFMKNLNTCFKIWKCLHLFRFSCIFYLEKETTSITNVQSIIHNKSLFFFSCSHFCHSSSTPHMFRRSSFARCIISIVMRLIFPQVNFSFLPYSLFPFQSIYRVNAIKKTFFGVFA